MSTGPLTLFSIICTGIFFLLVVMAAFWACLWAFGLIGLLLWMTLGYETTVYFSKVGVLFAFTGIIFGHLAHHKARKASLFPLTEAILCPCYRCQLVVLVSLIGILFMVKTTVGSRDPSHRITCRHNLMGISLFFAAYAADHGSLLPLLSTGKRLVYSFEAADATWFTIPAGLNVHFCPHDGKVKDFFRTWLKRNKGRMLTPTEMQEVINNSSYMYLGYVVTNDEEMRAFSEAYKERPAQGLPFDTDLEVPPGKGTNGGDTIFRLKKIARGISSEEKREEIPRIPVIWDRCLLAPGEHEPTLFHDPKGINVLFLNGLVEFIPYGENRWPLTEETMRMFWELENL